MMKELESQELYSHEEDIIFKRVRPASNLCAW